MDFGFYNMDCLEGMKQFPDKFFDLAIVDPPYGINVGNASMGEGGGVAAHRNRSAHASEARNHSARRIRVGGVNASHPKFTRRLMTATHQTPRISTNLNEWQNAELFSAAITFLTF